jgi:hypothetical protein
VIGLGLKELFFTSNRNNIGYQKCLQVLQINPEIYLPVSSLTESLASRVSGKINQMDQERQIGLKVLESTIFMDFGTLIPSNEIFTQVNNEGISLDQLKQQAFDFSVEIANKIIQDRDRISSSPPPSSVPSTSSTSLRTTSSSSNPLLSAPSIKRGREEEYIPERVVQKKRFTPLGISNTYDHRPSQFYGNQWNMNNPWQQQGLAYGGIRKKTRKYKNKKRKRTKRFTSLKRERKTKKNKKRKYKTYRKKRL